jgi:hypothetical protein
MAKNFYIQKGEKRSIYAWLRVAAQGYADMEARVGEAAYKTLRKLFYAVSLTIAKILTKFYNIKNIFLCSRGSEGLQCRRVVVERLRVIKHGKKGGRENGIA